MQKECSISAIRAAQEVRWIYAHEVDHDTSLEDVCDPIYWRNVHRLLASSKHTKIEVIALDGSWEAELRVIDTGDGWAKVRVLNFWQEDEGRHVAPPEGWKVDHVKSGWRVKNGNGDIVVSKKKTKEDALKEAADLNAKMAA